MFIIILKNIINNLTNKRTKRLNTKPLLKVEHKFILIILSDFDFKIILLNNVFLNNLIILFIIYYTLKIINTIV
jgi:hypothetical protein